MGKPKLVTVKKFVKRVDFLGLFFYVPQWAEYVTVDQDGEVIIWKVEPTPRDDGAWDNPEVEEGDFENIAQVDLNGYNWTEAILKL